MSKLVFSIVLLFCFALLHAHAPSSMDISFDIEEKILTIVIEHDVGNPENHYVDKVTISHGRTNLIVHQISRQDDREKVTLLYRVPDAQEGMTLNVLASCNRVGRLSRELVIE